jgi:hypothetical protein
MAVPAYLHLTGPQPFPPFALDKLSQNAMRELAGNVSLQQSTVNSHGHSLASC